VTLPAPDASKRPPRPSAPPPLKHGAKSRTVVLVQFTAVQPCGLHRPIPRRAAPPPPAPQVLPPPRSHSPPPLPLGPIPAYARDLNPQQQQAVLAPTNEPLLVLAATCADTCVPEYQPPACCTYQRHGAACPRGAKPSTVRMRTSLGRSVPTAHRGATGGCGLRQDERDRAADPAHPRGRRGGVLRTRDHLHQGGLVLA
jgi:hypothetical protein